MVPVRSDRAEGAHPDGAPFEVRREPAAGAGVVGVKASTALEGVRAGALDVNGYVDAKVAEATSHLVHLSPTQLAAVQAVVRDQLLADPHLRDLIHHATGTPAPADEG